jgi:large subunit ribosomal protein L4
MMDVPVLNLEGKQVGTMQVDPAKLGNEVNKQLLHEICLMYQDAQRVGTAKTKTRSEVAGSGRKLFRQKGTGNARVGERRTHKRRGGGTAFGPKPREYRWAMPRQARRLAAKMALLSKFQDGEAVVVDALTLPDVKTKKMAGIIRTLQLDSASLLIATPDQDRNVYLSARNIKGVEVLPAMKLNAYEIIRRKRLLVSKPAFEAFLAMQDKVEHAGEVE